MGADMNLPLSAVVSRLISSRCLYVLCSMVRVGPEPVTCAHSCSKMIYSL